MQNLSMLCQKALSDYVGIFLVDTRTGKSYTYADLNLLVEEVIAEVQKVELIVIKLENGLDFVVYFLASILSGRNVLLLNPSENTDDSNLKIAKINQKNVIIDKNFIKNKTVAQGEVVASKIPRVFVGTSATTGMSKLVPQSYDSIKSNIESISKHHKLSEGITIATALPLYHVNALYFSFMAAFVSGSRLVLLDPFNILSHACWCKEHKVDIVSTIPILISQYLRISEKILFKETNIKYFVTAAAPLSQKILLDFIEKYKIKILQGYGLSEAINFSCTIPNDLDDETYDKVMINHKIPSVGIALFGNDVEILINDNSLAEYEEVEGEIIIKGENVFSGYFKETDSEMFWNDYFKTGDLGYFKWFNSEKYFYISGRKKEIAKINSESVSLRWIDEAWGHKVSIPYDYFSTSFFNETYGELLAAVVQVEDVDLDLEKQMTIDFILKSFSLIKGIYRPSILLITGKNIQIRTPSGKARRWKFKDVLKKYSTYKKSHIIQVVKLNEE